MAIRPGYSNANERLMIISAKSLLLNDRVLPLSKMLTTMPVLNLSIKNDWMPDWECWRWKHRLFY